MIMINWAALPLNNFVWKGSKNDHSSVKLVMYLKAVIIVIGALVCSLTLCPLAVRDAGFWERPAKHDDGEVFWPAAVYNPGLPADGDGDPATSVQQIDRFEELKPLFPTLNPGSSQTAFSISSPEPLCENKGL